MDNGVHKKSNVMKSLGLIMFNLKNELMGKYGYNRIFLKEYLNSDTTLGIAVQKGSHLTFEIFGEIELTEQGWELVGVNYEMFEGYLNLMNEIEKEKEGVV